MNDLFDKLIKKANINTWTLNKEDSTAIIVMLDEEGDEFIIQVVDTNEEEFNLIGQAWIVMTMNIMNDIISVVDQFCNPEEKAKVLECPECGNTNIMFLLVSLKGEKDTCLKCGEKYDAHGAV